MPFDPPFSGYIQPPGIPPDPTGDCWRGPAGPMGPPGPVGTGDASNTPVTATGSTTPRMLQDRAADWVNVKDFGAKIDGTTDNNTAMNAARGAVAAGGTIYVPTGGFWNLPTLTSGPPAGNVLWHLSGNHFGAGTTPVTSVGNFDLVETYLTGTSGVKYWGKNFPLNAGPALRLDVGLTQTGGTEGHVSTGLQINTTQGAGTVESVWGIVVNSTVNADRDLSGAGFWPQCVPIVVNQFKKAGAQCWGIGIYVDDSMLTSSATAGGINGMEMGLKVCGLDDALGSTNTGYGARRFLDLIATTHGTGPAGEVGNGVLVRSGVGSNASVHHGFHTLNNVGYSFVCEATTGIIGLDTSLATLSGSAVRLAAGQKLSFEATEGNYLRYDSASSKLLYYVGGVAKWSVDASGNMRCAGTVTGSVTP